MASTKILHALQQVRNNYSLRGDAVAPMEEELERRGILPKHILKVSAQGQKFVVIDARAKDGNRMGRRTLKFKAPNCTEVETDSILWRDTGVREEVIV